MWSDALSLTGQKNSTLLKVKTKAQDKATQALRAEHQVLAGRPREAHRTLILPGLLSGRCPGVQAQFGKLFTYNHDEAEALPAQPLWPADQADTDPYRDAIGTSMVKQREGPEKQEPTLPWIMKHLKPMKAAGPYGDRYEYYKAMPQLFVHNLAQMALNSELSEGARF